MAEIDTQVPPWLQRNWAPRETYDPTPWLQQQYRLNMERQLMPLKVQQLNLANRAEQLTIAHQAMVNEQAGIEMQQVRDDMPIMHSWWKETGGDPGKILSLPTPAVKSVKAQQQVLNARKMAAETTLGMAYMAEQTALTKTTADLINDGYPIDEARKEDGTLDPQKIRAMAAARLKHKEQAAIDLTYARQEHYYDPVTGELVGGKIPVGEQEDKRYVNLRARQATLTDQVKANPNDATLQSQLRMVQDELQAWEVRHGATEETIETTPGGGITIRKGRTGASSSPEVLTTQNLSKAQQSLDASLTSIEAGKRLMPLISSETVGPRAFAESWVKDRVLANLYPELASEKRVTAERFAAEMRASAIRDLRSDGNISEKERAEITRAVPEINDPIDSPERARDLIKASLRSNGMRAIMTARRMKIAIPVPAVKALEDTDILQLVDSRLITADEAKAFWKMKRQP